MEWLDSQGLLLNFGCDMAAGLQELHQNSFVHRFVAFLCITPNSLSLLVSLFWTKIDISVIVKQLNLIQNVYIFRLNVTILLPCERSFEIVKKIKIIVLTETALLQGLALR